MRPRRRVGKTRRVALAAADGTLQDLEATRIREVLAECGGNQKLAARRLGIDVVSVPSYGDRTIAEMVSVIYRDTDPRLHRAAGLSVLAHLEDLVASGKVVSDGPPILEGRFAPA